MVSGCTPLPLYQQTHMNIVRLTDGLGNQLFQLAFAYALRKLNGSAVALDRSWFPEFGGKLRRATPRHFALAPYRNVSLPYATAAELNAAMYGKGLTAALRKLFHHRPGLMKEGADDLSPAALSALAGDHVLRVFAQKALYPDLVRDELLHALALPAEELGEANLALAAQMAAAPTIAVHIRRGDYMETEAIRVHGLCSADYYARAEAHIRQAAGLTEPPHLYLFSDDPAWVRENYRTDSPFTVVDLNDADHGHCDIHLMSCCHHAITANSTFSWWGAWLNNHPGKIVVAPGMWFADGRDTPGLIPATWQRL